MKKIFRLVAKRPMFWTFVIICVIFLPGALITPSENASVAIINSMSIDRLDEEYVVSALALVPVNNQNFTEKYKLISSKGESVIDALQNLQIEIGKKISLIHAGMVIIGEALGAEDITHPFSALARKNYIGSETSLVFTKGKGVDLLRHALDIDMTSGKKLAEIVIFNEKYIYPELSSIESFFKGVYSTSRSSFLGVVELKDEFANGIESSGGNSNGGDDLSSSGGSSISSSSSSSGNSQQQTKYVSNLGAGAIFKDGKLVSFLTPQQAMALGWVRSGETQSFIQVDNVEHEGKKNLSLTYRVKYNAPEKKVTFRNGKANIHFTVNLQMTLDEIIDYDDNQKVLNSQNTFMTNEVRNKISDVVKKEFSDALQVLKKNNCDALNFAKLCERTNKKKFEEFLGSIDNSDEYLKHLILTMNVNVSVKE